MTARFGLSGKEVAFETEPLFRSVGLTQARGVTVDRGAWRLATASTSLSDGGAWDQCHQILEQNPGVAHVEPDLQQAWIFDKRLAQNRGLGLRAGSAQPQDIGNGYAGDRSDNYWFRNDAHGQFDAALSAAGDPGEGRRVRIAHLDTGYDPAHATKPKFLRADLARNFVDPDRPNDATDRSSGPFNNFSHGCGTLSILASSGNATLRGFGCAPNAEIVPVRVANSVVLFWNSTIARGLDYVHELCRNAATRVNVVTMSMGGLPSQAWADAINALYEAGVVVITAAGNNYANAPTRFIVYPARFGRVVAACGVMADGSAYANLPPKRMAGNYGPGSKMLTALAGYTPNVPWARFGSGSIVDFDGNGTSSATPQVAGAAALWIEKHRAQYDAYPAGWMRVEAVREALFDSARKGAPNFSDELGYGMLRASDALSRQPAPASQLKQAAQDTADNAFLKLLLGDGAPGLTAAQGRAAMLELEAAQILAKAHLEGEAEAATPAARGRLIEAMLARTDLSHSLRAALETAAATRVRSPAPPPAAAPSPGPALSPADEEMQRHFIRLALEPPIPPPTRRRLRIYAYDPARATDPTLFNVSVATVAIPWESKLETGPIGEYLEVVDVDPASKACYAPVDLNHPTLLADHGLAPSESNPQFHQQMVYAVAMGTIERFERALGRKALWRRRRTNDETIPDNGFVQRLRIYPHALRDANAYYDPQKIALLFGYFRATDNSGSVTRGSNVFCAVSHDIVAHETTHALLDGLHPRYVERTNMDMAAFHEAFADVVALFQHFTMPEALVQQIRRAQGSIPEISRSLGAVAQQFGDAIGMHGALRQYIGGGGAQIPVLTDDMTEPHQRGAVLVSAIFGAFVTIFEARCADLIRLATNGLGVLPKGDIPVDLANRLADEAAKTAEHVLDMCIRALDYCPPINLDFGDYLRALITADNDVVPEDTRGYRVAFVDAFRARGIVPYEVRHLSEDSLLWEPPAMEEKMLDQFEDLVPGDRAQPESDKWALDLSWGLTSERAIAARRSDANGRKLKAWLEAPSRALMRQILGFEEATKDGETRTVELGGQTFTGVVKGIEVHSVRPCRRTGPDGSVKSTLVIELTQTFRANPDQQRYRGGCTLLIDLNSRRLTYLVRKKLFSDWSVKARTEAEAAAMTSAAEHGQVYYPPGDPTGIGQAFAIMHRCGRV